MHKVQEFGGSERKAKACRQDGKAIVDDNRRPAKRERPREIPPRVRFLKVIAIRLSGLSLFYYYDISL